MFAGACACMGLMVGLLCSLPAAEAENKAWQELCIRGLTPCRLLEPQILLSCVSEDQE